MHSLFRAVAVAVVAVTAAGCSTTVDGSARRAPDQPGSGGAIVALLDTGPYATTPGRPLGAVGADTKAQGL